ncbi:SpaA isopeptide-forming pilin-related protein [Streptomyces noursei]|uniref:MSCRAMM family protein n=1 Tax=Streptomyces noursei TaxID=1971 RepID=UPI00081CCFD3|nr:putative collagen-binding protein [Streptomyces noursei ATCC 11455]ANZ21919.1 putative collagen-binding protein [Streptomyces noursei ATCC 11455]MCZ0996515.1 SpaA isopeptide-forming pilin-related protein [Streptomyces noursei]
MSTTASRAATTGRRSRLRRPILTATAVALGTGLMFAPSAHALDKWGPGYTVPNGQGGVSHFGALGKPGSLYPHAVAHAYCADPFLAGPRKGVHYGPFTPFKTWTSKATGAQVSQSDLMRAAFILSDTHTPYDDQAAAADTAITTYLNRGTTYAFPGGQRATERLNYPNVPASVKTLATRYMNLAERYAGPYRVNIHTLSGTVTPGKQVPISVDVTSATGHRLPHVTLNLKASGASTAATRVTTDDAGTARTTLIASKAGAIDLTARAGVLPSTTLYAQLPDTPDAQRLVVTGGRSSATATAHLKATATGGTLQVVKIAADSHTVMGDVNFALKDSRGATVAQGMTDSHGIWKADGIPAGRYTLHEVKAAPGYQLAPDRAVTIGDLVPGQVTITDTKIAEQPAPRPRPIVIHELPQTGA